MEARRQGEIVRGQMSPPLTGFLAPVELENAVRSELGSVQAQYGRLLISSAKSPKSFWAQNIWYAPQYIEIASISDAAKKLRAIQRNWVLYSFGHHRRAKLIQDALPPINFRPLAFGESPKKGTLGSWTLVEPDLMLVAPKCSSAFPNGEIAFKENKTAPPSRAYLKLWEIFTVLGALPKKGEFCIDLGASPGGWTWVLAELGAEVVAIDRAPLETSLMKKRNIEFLKGNAFHVEENRLETAQWIFSDLACYPEKLFEWVSPLTKKYPEKNFICTLKFQGASGYEIVSSFSKIPGSKLFHLFHNKHELTWVRLARMS